MVSLLHPSRSRPEKAFKTAQEWANESGLNEINYVISLDSDDPLLEYYKHLYSTKGLIVNDNKSVVDATNKAAAHSTGDILVYLSDDFKCFPDWGKVITERIGDTSKPVMLKIDDCLQDFHVGVLTMPVMTRTLYNLLGYFWHPAYFSMHVDVDLYETCKRLGVIKYAKDIKFPHWHVSNGKAPDDETYRRSAANWNQGLEVIKKRRALGFPV